MRRRVTTRTRARRHVAIVAATCLVAAAIPFVGDAADRGVLVIEDAYHHLGDSHVTDWPEGPAAPEGTTLTLEFKSPANSKEYVLALRTYHVENSWRVVLNDTRIATLKPHKPWKRRHVVVPARAVTNGRNILKIVSTRRSDDILVGEIRLHRDSLRSVLKLSKVTVLVADVAREAVPAKLTILDAAGAAAPVYYAADDHQATREGIVYSAREKTVFELPPGTYTLYATRGMEWSRPQTTLQLQAGKSAEVALTIEREVDTTGFVVCDSHIHSVPASNHGDATLKERAVTLAAEGVELAITTDHNHVTDYEPTQRELKLRKHYTPVPGNEVTTGVGHVNAFPMKPGDLPNHRESDWVKLVADIRARGAKAIVLNHPNYPAVTRSEFARQGFSRVTGRFRNDGPFPFDALEVINSGSPTGDPVFVLRDWIALLNNGHRVAAVGTSDSHTVGDPVGQGRTYLASKTDDPSRIDTDGVIDALVAGRSSISLGLFATVDVGGKSMGDTVTATEPTVRVRLRVAGPSWIAPRRAAVLLNGVQVAHRSIDAVAGAATDVTLTFDIPRPAGDAHLICVAIGDSVDDPSWRTIFGYSIAATNPVYLDADGDGQYTSPRAQGAALFAGCAGDLSKTRALLRDLDDALCVAVLVAAEEHYLAETPDDPAAARRKLLSLTGIALGQRAVITQFVQGLEQP